MGSTPDTSDMSSINFYALIGDGGKAGEDHRG
jgi:hypothetical protein